MGNFFFDESIHERGDFIVGAFVYSRVDPTESVAAALAAAGLEPQHQEYKSGANFSREPRFAVARQRLLGIVQRDSRIALAVLPSTARKNLGEEALRALRQFVEANNLTSVSHDVFLDQGLFPSAAAAHRKAQSLGVPATCAIHPECDSRSVRGLQLADLVAHRASTMLLEHQGFVTKTVKAGPNSGYDPDLDINLGFELWAGIRWQFFATDPPHPDTLESPLDFQVTVEPRGLYISPLCSRELAARARERFGTMYLGCIH